MKPITIAPNITLEEAEIQKRKLAHDHMKEHGVPNDDNVLDSTIYRCGLDYMRVLQTHIDNKEKREAKS
jgi:hypothetical protein